MRITTLSRFFALSSCLLSSATLAVVTTVQVGLGAAPDNVTVQFPDGALQAVDASDPGASVAIAPDPVLPGVFRITLSLEGADGNYLLTDPAGGTIIEIPVRDGLVQKAELQDPQALADYLDGLLQQQRFDDYDEVWDELPESMQNQIEGIWDAQIEAHNQQLAAEAAAEDAAALNAAGDAWVVNSANFFATAALNPAQATDPQVLTGEQVLRGREHYNQVLGPLREQREQVRVQLNDAIVERNTFASNLESYKKDESFWESLDFVSDRREEFLESGLGTANKKVSVLRGELAFADENIARIEAEAARYEGAVTLEGVKNDPALLAAEEARRFEQAVQLNQELATKNAQFVEGHKQFEAQIQHIDQQIANANANGGDHLVEGLESQKESIQHTYDLWKDGMDVAIEGRGRDLQRAFAQNAADGIGPTDTVDLIGDTVRNGLDPKLDLFGVDENRVGATAESTSGLVKGARFVDPATLTYTWGDYATDFTIEYYTGWTDPVTWAQRYGAFWGGVGRAGKDGIYDIYVIGKGGTELVWQAEEVALNYYFDRDSNIFGRDKLQMVESGYDTLSTLDSEQIYATTQDVSHWVERRWEMQAGSGEAGLQQALGDVGYVTGTVAGVEEVGIKVVVVTTRYGARAARVAAGAEGILGAGTDAARVGSVAGDAGRAEDLATGFRDMPTVLDEGASQVASGAGGGAVRMADEVVPPSGAVDSPPIRGPPPADSRGIRMSREGENIVLEREGGGRVALAPDQRLGGGCFSEAYSAPTGGGTVCVKITKPANATGDLAGDAIDLFNYQNLIDVDPNLIEVPKIHNRYQITAGENAGGWVTIVEEAPKSFQDAIKANPHILTPGGDMTPGQVRGYLAGVEELNSHKLVLADGKLDNFTLRPIGPPGSDQWRMVLQDMGSVLKMTDADAARAMQRTIDNPSVVEGVVGTPWHVGDLPLGRGILQEHLAENFDHLVDWDALNHATGQQFDTLGKGIAEGVIPERLFPYNPSIGTKFPSLRQAVGDAASPAIGSGGVGAIGEVPTGQSAFSPGPTLPYTDTLKIPVSGPGNSAFSSQFQFTPGGTSTLIDPNITVMQPGHIVHIPADRLGNLNEVFDPSVLQFMSRRFVIGACQPYDSTECGLSTGAVVFNCPESRASQCEYAFEHNPEVSLFESNYGRAEQQVPADSLFHASGSWGQAFDDQWALKRVGFGLGDRDAWALAGESLAPVIVAVIDTGVAWGHPDLDRRNIWVNRGEVPSNGVDDDGNGYVDDIVGWNFVEHNNLPWDLDGHGTLVAGIIAASRDNDRGMAGINPAARIMVLRALDRAGNTRSSFVSEAIVYAANNGAKVINLSVGGGGLSRTEALAIEYARSRGALVVAAAGNEGVEISDYGPAGLEQVLTVAASDPADARLPVSNWGTQVDLAAPGVDVLGLRAPGTDLMLKFKDPEYHAGDNIVSRDYYRATGTSFAAPIVSGIASLILARDPGLKGQQIRRMLLNSARDIDTPGIDNLTGYGLVDAPAALEADPDFYADARIQGVAVIQEDGKAVLRVEGMADANDFVSATLELGRGPAPKEWEPLKVLDRPVRGGRLHDIEPSHFSGSKEWTLRVLTRHRNGTIREARFSMNIG